MKVCKSPVKKKKTAIRGRSMDQRRKESDKIWILASHVLRYTADLNFASHRKRAGSEDCTAKQVRLVSRSWFADQRSKVNDSGSPWCSGDVVHFVEIVPVSSDAHDRAKWWSQVPWNKTAFVRNIVEYRDRFHFIQGLVRSRPFF